MVCAVCLLRCGNRHGIFAGQFARDPDNRTSIRTSEITFVSVHGANPGGYASINVETAPGAECSIRYVTPHGTISRAKGLDNQIADSDGKLTWTWNIGSKTEPGKGTVTVTCNGSTASTPIEIQP